VKLHDVPELIQDNKLMRRKRLEAENRINGKRQAGKLAVVVQKMAGVVKKTVVIVQKTIAIVEKTVRNEKKIRSV